MENPGFLKNKYGSLHNSPEVKSASSRTEKLKKEKVSQNPNEQIQNYLDRFKEILDRKNPDKRKQGIEALRKILHEKLIIKDKDINYEYFIKQEQLIAEQQGYGVLGIPHNFKENKKQEIQNDQKKSLDYWIDYLTSADANYPDWAKYWAFRSMTEMGGYNKKERKFSKRNKDSAQAFPTLNAGCLAEVIGSVIKKQKYIALEKDIKKNPNESDKDFKERGDAFIERKNVDFENFSPEFRELLTTENFSKLYTYALEQFGDLKWENLENTKGYWKTYKQGTPGKILADTLQGYPLEWCTRNEETADTQLQGGDFHVYYSEDSNGFPKVPRLAIRMNGHRKYNEDGNEIKKEDDITNKDEIKQKIYISEPASGGHTIFDNLSEEQKKFLGLDNDEAEDIYNPATYAQKYAVIEEQFILDKTQTIGEIRGIEAGQNIDQFIQPILNEKLKEFGEEGEVYLKKSQDMKEVTRITEKNRLGQTLDNTDLRFLYEVDSQIEGFGYQEDPRINQILTDRNVKDDLMVIFNIKDDDNELALCLLKNRDGRLLSEYIHTLNGLNSETIEKIVENGGWGSSAIAKCFDMFIDKINSKIVDKLIEKQQAGCIVENLDKLKEIDQNELVLKILKYGKERSNNLQLVLNNLDKFGKLNSDVAVALLTEIKEHGLNFKNFTKNIDRFDKLDARVAGLLIDGDNHSYAYFHDNFSKFDNNSELALKIIETRDPYFVVKHFNSFNNLSNEVILKLVETDVLSYLSYATSMDGVCLSAFVLRLIDLGKISYVLTNFYRLYNLNQEVALKLIDSGLGGFVASGIHHFKEIDEKVN
jgi:hypothetical protein